MSQVNRPENMGDIESLIASKNIDTSRWYPISVDEYRNDVSQGIFASLDRHFRSNIAYSLQYLEYLELQMRELNVSSVIRAMLFKNFIIIAASIIEIAFYHLAKVNGKIKLRTEKQVHRQDIKKPDDITIPCPADKYTLFCFQNLPTGVEDLTRFETLIQIVRDNKLLTDTDLLVNKGYLKLLRKLRNKIHLTTATDPNETDYNKFWYSDYLSAKFFLLIVLTDSVYGKDKQLIFPQLFDAVLSQVKQYKSNKIQTYIWKS
ncbi:MAG: hypothetical protein K2N05_04100 [Muribaculaceae bacterium]|nr:hypothetical protein [Muribaculaceae bacterium]